MEYAVLGVWLIQSVVGGALLAALARRGRRPGPTVLAHAAVNSGALVLWIVFIAQGSIVAAWLAFATVTVGNGIGDYMLVNRWRRMTGSASGFWPDYRRTVGAIFRGFFPPGVTFHTCFSGVVYFSCLGVCIGASVA